MAERKPSAKAVAYHRDLRAKAAALGAASGYSPSDMKKAVSRQALTEAILILSAATRDALDEIRRTLDEHGNRLAEAEDGGLRYCGAWQRAVTYRKGDTVTRRGSLFVAVRGTSEEPGKADDWQLAAKCGRDGRDAK